MYSTPIGLRGLQGSEARLVESAAAMIVDLLSEGDRRFGCDVFDQLPYLDRLRLLEKVLAALLCERSDVCERTEQTDAVVRLIYAWIDAMFRDEMAWQTHRLDGGELPSWRDLIGQVLQETGASPAPHHRSLCCATVNQIAARVVEGGWVADDSLRSNSPIWRRESPGAPWENTSKTATLLADPELREQRRAIVSRLKRMTSIDRVSE